MKSSNQHILETLIINKDYRDAGLSPKSFDELRKIIEDRYKKLGPGTKQDPIDFNDIDVSNIDSFYDHKGIFEYMRFKYIDISDWDVSNAKSMHRMFSMCKELESIGDLLKWNVSNVTDMCSMFWRCRELKSVVDISKWDVSKVTNMGYMFYCCESFNQDISNWDVSSLRHHQHMFYGCPIKDEYKPKFK